MDADFPHEAGTKATRPKRSRAKRDIQRPYLPPYVDHEEIAYRFRVSIGTVANWSLPPPVWVFGIKRWRWFDIEQAIEEQNLLAGEDDPGAPSQPAPFLEGIRRVASADE